MRAQAAGRAGGRAAIELRGVSTETDGGRALDHVDLEIPRGGITAVIGAWGAGRRALIAHLLGRRAPDEGELVVLGESIGPGAVAERSEYALRVGVVLRDGGLFSSMSVRDNVAFLLRNETQMDAAQIAGIVRTQLDALGLTRVASALPGDIAPGQRKRAGFARALATEPEVVVFDRPEARLDAASTALFGELIEHLHVRFGGTYVLVTQDVSLARRIADQLVLMRGGRVLAAGAPGDLMTSADRPVRELLDRSDRTLIERMGDVRR